jgi:hypothetical protein
VGFTGSVGYTGSVGFAGSLGYTGSVGFAGSLGYTGSIGFTGSVGYTGSVGFAGSLGYAGSIGFAGSLGYTGSVGYAGSVGFVGSAGIGYSGSSGSVTITNELASGSSHYLTMSTTNSGTFTTAVVSDTQLYFVPNSGTLNATNFNVLSDQNYKTDITTLVNALASVESMRGVKFQWLQTGQPSAGVIAQEIQQVAPQLVANQSNRLSVNYDGLIAYLIEAIKQLSERVNKLEQNISGQK